jgi:predicted phage terminase large subunit-like protein
VKAARVLPLSKYIPAVSPRFDEPRHLAPVVEVIERTERESVHAVFSMPPRHGKSELAKHAIVRRLRALPQTRICYVTYAAAFALKKSREIRRLYQRAGGRVIDDANTLADWRTTDTGTDDGGVWATSVGGPVTGEGFNLIVIDDAVKSRAIAESGVEREKLWDWYRDTLSTREEPHCSTLDFGTRWHVDDLGGRLLAEGFEGVNLPAIDAQGRALWPERYPLSALQRIRERLGDYGWSSLYMGQPFARGGRVFGDTHFYDMLPNGMNIRIGLDLAYSTKTRADRSVAVVLGECDGVFYVLDVLRVQVEAPKFIQQLKLLQAFHGNPGLTGYFGGTERGVLDVMKSMGIGIDAKPATTDKFTRCQPVAAAWNAGKILLPRDARWADAFVSELVAFTGIRDVHDDQVDALAGAFDALAEDSDEGTFVEAMANAVRNGFFVDRGIVPPPAPPPQPGAPSPGTKLEFKPSTWGLTEADLDRPTPNAIHIDMGPTGLNRAEGVRAPFVGMTAYFRSRDPLPNFNALATEQFKRELSRLRDHHGV